MQTPSSLSGSSTSDSLQPPRAISLDALRGLAIVGMVFAGLLPFGANPSLPAWMFHAQCPPPTNAFNPDIPGITWVDLVFPMFLFAMGAAIPFALSGRLERGIGIGKILGQSFFRSLLLIFFGIFIANINRWTLVDIYGHYAGNALTLAAFASLFLIFVRFPKKWGLAKAGALRLLGWAVIGGLIFSPRPEGAKEFSVLNNDIIIVLLGNVSFAITLVWLFTRKFPWIRLAVILMGLALHYCKDSDIWVNRILSLNFLGHWFGEEFLKYFKPLFNPMYLKYLAVAIPGTFAGDLLYDWIKPSAPSVSFDIQNSRWRQLSLTRCIVLSVLCLVIVVATVIGLQKRMVVQTVIIDAICAGIGLITVFAPPGRRMPAMSMKTLGGHMRITSHLFRALFLWGIVWLALGLGFEKYQGGIHKDPATLSYYFTTAGLSTFLLIVLIAGQEILQKANPLLLVYRCGQNPMIAYVAAGMLIIPFFSLIPVGGGQNLYGLFMSLFQTPWAKAGAGAIITAILIVIVSLLSRYRIFWRT